MASNNNKEYEDGKAPSTTAPVDQVMIAMCQFDCTTCGTKIAARIPPYRVYNFAEVSGVTMGHERLQKCPQCGSQFVCLIGGVKDAKIELIWKQVQTSQSAIEAPTTKKTNAGVTKQ